MTRARVEISIIVIATFLFLLLVPQHNLLYMSLALGFVAYIFIDARFTSAPIWQVLSEQPSTVAQWCHPRYIYLVTALVAVAFILIGLYRGNALPVLHWLMMCLVYIGWAILQQYIFMYYFLGRINAVLGFKYRTLAIIVSGFAYGLVHLPQYTLVALTILAGLLWAASYLFYQRLLPLAISHGVLGASYYFWVLNRDLLNEWATYFA